MPGQACVCVSRIKADGVSTIATDYGLIPAIEDNGAPANARLEDVKVLERDASKISVTRASHDAGFKVERDQTNIATRIKQICRSRASTNLSDPSGDKIRKVSLNARLDNRAVRRVDGEVFFGHVEANRRTSKIIVEVVERVRRSFCANRVYQLDNHIGGLVEASNNVAVDHEEGTSSRITCRNTD